ncbi:MAG: TraR/DksA family transcriptional regulator [Chloroflexi bacterium]|nr:TraR/DksA family transcriptional regulator [Chloroflexota bacterium]
MLDLQGIHRELVQARAEMLARAQATVETAKGDDADLAAIAQNNEQVLWLAKDAQARLAAIESALLRIEQGTYGACVNCGSAIPAERLYAIPTTLCCVACQNKLGRNTRR